MCLTNMKRMEHALRMAILVLGIAVPLLAQGSQTLSVSAFMDIWQSGGYNDGSGAEPPASYAFAAAPGQALTFSSVTGTWSCGNGATPNGPDGTNNGSCYVNANTFTPTGPFSGLDMTDFSRPLVGMFLADTLPASVAPTLRFYWTDNSQGGIQTNFAVLSPQIGQVFFIGDGLTGTGTGAVQVFNVPPTATRLYLGYVDLCSNVTPGCYSDNSGSMTVTFAISTCSFNVSNVTPQTQLADRAWATQAGIMRSWRSGVTISAADAAALADSFPPQTDVFVTAYDNGGVSGCAEANDCSISLPDYTHFLTRSAIDQFLTEPLNPTACGLAIHMQTYGPMAIVTGVPTPNFVHAMVVMGVTGDGTNSGASVNVIDPVTGAQSSQSLDTLVLGLEAAVAAGWPEFGQFP